MTTRIVLPRATRREWAGLAVLALPTLLLSIDIFVLLLALRRQRRLADPLLDLRLLASRTFTAAMGGMTLNTMLTGAVRLGSGRIHIRAARRGRNQRCPASSDRAWRPAAAPPSRSLPSGHAGRHQDPGRCRSCSPLLSLSRLRSGTRIPGPAAYGAAGRVTALGGAGQPRSRGPGQSP